jgi:hypothetical protein
VSRSTLSDEEINQIFDWVDVDHGGSISAPEFEEFLADAGDDSQGGGCGDDAEAVGAPSTPGVSGGQKQKASPSPSASSSSPALAPPPPPTEGAGRGVRRQRGGGGARGTSRYDREQCASPSLAAGDIRRMATVPSFVSC